MSAMTRHGRSASPPPTGAAASSPPQHGGGKSPRRCRRDSGRWGRSCDIYNSSRVGNSISRNHRSSQNKTRRSDDRRETSGSSSSAPDRRPKKEHAKKGPDSCSDVAALKTPRRVTPSLVQVSSSDKCHLLSRRVYPCRSRVPVVFYDSSRATSTDTLGLRCPRERLPGTLLPLNARTSPISAKSVCSPHAFRRYCIPPIKLTRRSNLLQVQNCLC